MKSIHKIIIVICIIVLTLSVSIVILFNIGKILALKNIHVSGNNNLSSKLISKLSELDYGKPIYTIDVKKIKNEIEDNPFIEYAEVKKAFPDTIKIHITERKPIAILIIEENGFLIDKDGVILEKTNKPYVKNDFLRIQFLEKLDNIDYYEGETIAIPELSRLIKDILKIDNICPIKRLISEIRLSLVKRNVYIEFYDIDINFEFINGINTDSIKKAKTIYLELKNKKNTEVKKIVISDNLVISKN